MPWLIRRGGCPGCKLGCALTGSTDPNVLRLGQPCFFFFFKKMWLEEEKKKENEELESERSRAGCGSGWVPVQTRESVCRVIYLFIYICIYYSSASHRLVRSTRAGFEGAGSRGSWFSHFHLNALLLWFKECTFVLIFKMGTKLKRKKHSPYTECSKLRNV